MPVTVLAATPTAVTVDVGGTRKTYPAAAEALAMHLATGGRIGSLTQFVRDAAALVRGSDWLRAVEGWVWLDDSAVAYRIEVRGSGHYDITGAAQYGPVR